MAPDRIVSLAPSNTEILYALDAADRVVATTAICDHPEAAQELPSVGGWTNPDLDAVLDHDPELVLASDALQDEAVERCRDAGLTVRQFTPTHLHEVCNTIKAIGEIVDAEPVAEDVVDEMNTAFRTHARPYNEAVPRIYCEEWHEPPMVSGNWVPGIIDLLGGDYLIAEGDRSRTVTADEIQAFDPEYIFLHPCGYGDSADPQTIYDRDDWSGITAVEQGHVYVVDDALLNRPTPRLVEGMKAIKKRL